MTVGHGELGGSLASRNTYNISITAPFNDIRQHDRGDNEFTSSFHGSGSIISVHDGTATNHDISVVLGAKVGKVRKTVGSGKSELDNLESPINGGLHRLGTSFRGGSSKNGTCSDFGKLVKNSLAVFKSAGMVEARRQESSAGGRSGGVARKDAGGSKSKSHGSVVYDSFAQMIVVGKQKVWKGKWTCFLVVLSLLRCFLFDDDVIEVLDFSSFLFSPRKMRAKTSDVIPLEPKLVPFHGSITHRISGHRNFLFLSLF